METSKGYGGLPKGFDGYEDSEIVVLPVPYDRTSTWLKGSRRGPRAIIEASRFMYLYDIDTDSEVYLRGIHTDRPVRVKSSPGAMVEAVRARVDGHLARGKFVVTLGGEHSVSVGAVRSYAEKFRDLSVLQLDAHADLQDEFEGSRYNHACAMARVRECCPAVQVGVRSVDAGELSGVDPGSVFFAETMRGGRKWMDEAIARLSDRVYLTIDLDFFDVSLMPATGTPEPGGLFWHDTLDFLRRVIAERDIVGFDVVELCPNRYSKPSDFLAAKLVYILLSHIFKKRTG
ncbi:MAG: agmatinase [Spirochaetes bacterium]|nr:agmatinase [Spirochaetota bacterium]